MTTQVELTLTRIQQNLRAVDRLINSAEDYLGSKNILEQCSRNLRRISSVISRNRFEIIQNSISSLIGICDEKLGIGSNRNVSYVAERICIVFRKIACRESFITVYSFSGRGRPSIQITRDQWFLNEGYTASKIANLLKCSKFVVYKKMYKEGLTFRGKYTNISDDDLLSKIIHINSRFPNSGAVMMHGYLRAEGITVQRFKIRELLSRIDPVETAARWSSAVPRRVYSVPTPNSLWHMDAHLKLVRWGFITHGCIDGYSRLIIYVECSTSITASTVINIFSKGVQKYGLPSRVRSDHGYENLFVAFMMNLLRGLHRASHITGRSVHNQRIERLWRDVFLQVILIHSFYTEFNSLETEGKLDPNNDIHRYVLHLVYLTEINKALKKFANAWNKHKIRTKHCRTPREMWLDGMLQNCNSSYSATQEVFSDLPNLQDRLLQRFSNLGIDINAPAMNNVSDNLTSSPINLDDQQQVVLNNNIIESDACPKNEYITGIELLNNVMN